MLLKILFRRLLATSIMIFTGTFILFQTTIKQKSSTISRYKVQIYNTKDSFLNVIIKFTLKESNSKTHFKFQDKI